MNEQRITEWEDHKIDMAHMVWNSEGQQCVELLLSGYLRATFNVLEGTGGPARFSGETGSRPIGEHSLYDNVDMDTIPELETRTIKEATLQTDDDGEEAIVLVLDDGSQASFLAVEHSGRPTELVLKIDKEAEPALSE